MPDNLARVLEFPEKAQLDPRYATRLTPCWLGWARRRND